MSWSNKLVSIRSLTISFTVLGLFALCLFFGADFSTSEAKVANSANFGGTAFPGTGGGAIPDGGATGAQDPGTPVTITFAVTGVTGAPTDVSLDMDITHTWVGDIVATLTAPDGTTNHLIMSYTGNTGVGTFGDSSNVAGLYTFEDAATGNWWTAATGGTSAFDIPLGSYKASDNGGTQTDISPSFTGLASANGTWTLSITDGGAGDTGTLNAATLNITAGTPPPASSETTNDYDGDGTTDYAQTRNESAMFVGSDKNTFKRARSFRERNKLKKQYSTANIGVGGSPGTDLVWYIHNSNDSSLKIGGHGMPATDFVTPSDFDGDDKTDFAVWRQAGAGSAAFYILDSSTNTVRQELFGQNADDPTVVGDYDGDGSADVAVYRCPPTDGQCTFFYRGSAGGGETTFQTWGFGNISSVFANPGDFDGDGKYDFNVQTGHPTLTGKGLFILLRSNDFGVEYTQFGNDTDVIAPGDYDGDGKSDYTVIRVNGDNLTWYTLLSSGGNQQLNWGLNSTEDVPTPGDYDGDGSTDYSIWRPDADEDENYFYSLKSSDGTLEAFEWGSQFDYPPANSQVH